MTDETPFQDTLDELALLIKPPDGAPTDLAELWDRYFDTCAVFADWLEEQGDWRAAGYRWISQHRKHPRHSLLSWNWWRFGDTSPLNAENLPSHIWNRLPGRPLNPQTHFKSYDTRRDAESALCKALILLEPDK